ncbi:hypothetical protein ACFQ7B_40070 [Streptomyces erythrochromogenes]|uniref:hypothetical protein n=1 Tax=Streptomyces erythrochromogenes TaxID=285574 RepID=UPI0036925EC8
MDTGLACNSCAAVLGDRREMRRSVRSQVVAELGNIGEAERQAEVERRMRLTARRQAVMDMTRREQAKAERELRVTAVEKRRAELAALQAEQAEQHCTDCGISDSGGLCLACTAARGTAQTVQNAVDVAVAMRADLRNPKEIRELSARVESDTLATIAAAVHEEAHQEPSVREFARLTIARELLAKRTWWALYRLEQGPRAAAAADQARRATRLHAHLYESVHDLREAVASAEDKARANAARELLGQLLADVAQVRRQKREVSSTDWDRVLAVAALRPLAGETTFGRAPDDLGDVSGAGPSHRAALQHAG